MDLLDRAKKIEMDQRQQALDAQQARAAEIETPHEVDGVRVCLDCGDEIAKARLAARPEAALCVKCKQRKETVEAHYA